MSTPIDATLDFIERLGQQPNIECLLFEFEDLISQFGFTGFAFGDLGLPPPQAGDVIGVFTWPDAWVERWVGQNYMTVDPVVHQLLASNKPFRWRDIRGQAWGIGARVMDEGRDFGFSDGFGIAIHDSQGPRVGLSLGTGSYELGPREEATLHMAALYFQSRFASLRPGSASRVGPRLSDRETECLLWVAQGKTDWEISQILTIGECTVRDHVRRSMRKLGASSRAHAVALAILHGLIRP